MHRQIAFLLSSLSLISSSASYADDIDVSGALGAGVSSRTNDALASATLRGRYGFTDSLSALGSLNAAAAQNDQRAIGGFSVAGEIGTRFGRWRPAIRVGVVHQHETPSDEAAADPIQTAVGVSESIRHRTGAIAEVGTTVEITDVWRGAVFARADVGAQLMIDDGGPRSYVLVNVGLGFRFSR